MEGLAEKPWGSQQGVTLGQELTLEELTVKPMAGQQGSGQNWGRSVVGDPVHRFLVFWTENDG